MEGRQQQPEAGSATQWKVGSSDPQARKRDRECQEECSSRKRSSAAAGGRGWFSSLFGSQPPEQPSLESLYRQTFLPLEEHSNFSHFFAPPLSDANITGEPMVLLIGPYSVGKTSFIQHLLGDPEDGVPGANVGPEPTTDGFMAVMHGRERKTIMGHVCAADSEKPFQGLRQFGSNLLDKFQCAECPAEILQHMTLIDTPGVLSGEKQRIGRNYDMADVCKWFADRSDVILLLFDAHKQDISDELKDVIERLQGNEGKIRIILNKADQVSPWELTRVYGAITWYMGKVVKTPDVPKVYISSFWKEPLKIENEEMRHQLEQEKRNLFEVLCDVPKSAGLRRGEELLKRGRALKAHVLICAHLRSKMPLLWGDQMQQQKLLADLETVFQDVSKTCKIPRGDLPEVSSYKKKLEDWIRSGKTFSHLPSDRPELRANLDRCLDVSIPSLMKALGTHQPIQA